MRSENTRLKQGLIRARQNLFPAIDQAEVIARDFPYLPNLAAEVLKRRDAETLRRAAEILRRVAELFKTDEWEAIPLLLRNIAAEIEKEK